MVAEEDAPRRIFVRLHPRHPCSLAANDDTELSDVQLLTRRILTASVNRAQFPGGQDTHFEACVFTCELHIITGCAMIQVTFYASMKRCG